LGLQIKAGAVVGEAVFGLMTHAGIAQIPAAAADNLFHGRHRYLICEGWKKIRKGIRGMIWKFLPDGGIKLGELNSHNII